uniref:Uncharacterized protein n=1 Tax=Romanomermis culicivorax TaxID=13658 RepID=A0A915K7X1_ROMCU
MSILNHERTHISQIFENLNAEFITGLTKARISIKRVNSTPHIVTRPSLYVTIWRLCSVLCSCNTLRDLLNLFVSRWINDFDDRQKT